MINKLITLILFLTSSLSFAINEANYNEVYEKEVVPFYQKGQSKTFKAHDRVELHYHQIDQKSSKAMVILTGRTEPTNKYAEIVYDLKELGYDYYLLDSRGQGFSQHLLDDSQKGYVKKYQDYIKDMETFYKLAIAPKKYDEVVLLAHSMGAAISLRFAELNPKAFNKMIVSTPMLELLLGDRNESLVLSYMKVMKWLGKGKDYVAGGGSFESFPRDFESNRVTHSRARREMSNNILERTPLLKMGAATNNWVIEAIQLGRKTFKQRKKLEGIPLLMFQAGIEHFVREKRQRQLCEEVSTCKFIRYPEAKHEMLQEKDEIRDQVLDEIRLFLGS